MKKTLSVFFIAAVAFLGLAPMVVCAMPEECPMQAQADDCCETEGESSDTVCHPEMVAAKAQPGSPGGFKQAPYSLSAQDTQPTLVGAVRSSRSNSDSTRSRHCDPPLYLTHESFLL